MLAVYRRFSGRSGGRFENVCGRYTLSHQQWVDSLFGGDLEKLPYALRSPRFNVAPGQLVLGVGGRAGAHAAEALHWGIEAPWRGGPSRLINARAEKLPESRFWRPLLEDGRCAIPADGFYEWRSVGGGVKRPYWFSLADGEPFAFAGLRRAGKDREPGAAGECVIVTVAANELVNGVHDRMPAMLDRAAIGVWLDADADEALGVLRPYPSTGMVARAVSRLVNDARREGPELIAPAGSEWPDQPAPGSGAGD